MLRWCKTLAKSLHVLLHARQQTIFGLGKEKSSLVSDAFPFNCLLRPEELGSPI
jgi:hypothetical protein